MGFFSAIKKMLGGKPQEAPVDAATETLAEPAAEDVAVESAPRPADSAQPDAHPTAKADVEANEDAEEATADAGGTPGAEVVEIVEDAEASARRSDLVAEPPAAPAASPAQGYVEDAETMVMEPAVAAPIETPAEAPVDTPADTPAAIPTDVPAHDPVAAMVAPPAEAAAPVAQSVPASAEEAALTLRLREAEPRLSTWLAIILEDVPKASPLLWQRLRFLLRSLEAPAAEADAFITDFQAWLERMEYLYVEEFRSELQYRLALALDMEDEEDERSRLFLKLSEGLARTREQFTKKLDALFASHGALDAAFWEEMEELFLMADMGYDPALTLIERLKERARAAGVTEPSGLRSLLQEELEEIFRMPRRISAVNPPEVILLIGVNGVGKTTTIAKLAHRDRMQGKKVLIAAADTFRAAATEQLGVWAERVGADFHRKEAGADPAAVAFEAMDIAVAGQYDVLYVDTAGRLQTKTNLMEELKKIRAVLGKKHPGAPHRSILVIDATTGQNALSQTKLFKEAAGVDEVILTKLDGTAKGGVAIAVAMQFEVPITFIGLGEKLEDLRPFNGRDFALALLGKEEAT